MDQLIKLLAQIKNPGRFAVNGKLSAVYPGLKLKNLDTLALPLQACQAERIIALCEQAPFGRGEQTVVDTRVRDVWQLSPEEFEITNPQWQASFETSVALIAEQLGLSGCRIDASLYKLLVYGKDSFFIQHRDTEKVPNMFATLVVNLPSSHEGGELIVSHGDNSESYTFSDEFQPEFVAFYADCYHEIKPVTSGYRLCLIYNLAIEDRPQQPILSQQIEIAEQISKSLQQWSNEALQPPFLAYLLEHSYSEQNLCLNNLKNSDFARASTLLSAAEKNDCQAYLCLVSYYRLSYGDCYAMGYRRYHDDEPGEDDFEEYGIEEEKIYAHHFISSQGVSIPVENLALEEASLLASIPLQEGEGKELHIAEATGNEGASKELWYHRGAVILWPKRNDLEVALVADQAYGMHYLKGWLKAQDVSQGEPRQVALKLAHHLVDRQSPYDSEPILNNLIEIGDIDLLNKFIGKRLHHSLKNLNKQELVAVFEAFGWDAFADRFSQIVHQYLQGSYRARELVCWLCELLLEKNLSDQGRHKIAQWFQDVWASKMPWKDGLHKENLMVLLQMTALLGDRALANEVFALISNQSHHLFLIDTYGPALIGACQNLANTTYQQAILKQFAQDVSDRLQQAYPHPPSPPEDWHREGKIECKCEFCVQINRFLPDPQHNEIYFHNTLKRNLIHIEEKIAVSGLDLGISIHRDPPKFAGRCYKNQNSYDQALSFYKRAQDIKANL